MDIVSPQDVIDTTLAALRKGASKGLTFEQAKEMAYDATMQDLDVAISFASNGPDAGDFKLIAYEPAVDFDGRYPPA